MFFFQLLLESNKSNEVQLQSQQIQSFFKEKESELFDQLFKYQSHVSCLQEELQKSQAARPVVVSPDIVRTTSDVKHVVTTEFYTQTDPLSKLFENGKIVFSLFFFFL